MMLDDPFAPIARYYDPIMEHVDYERWFTVTTALADLVPNSFRHLDAACGTGTLLGMLRKAGWQSCGVDLSESMIRSGKKRRNETPFAIADLRHLPFHRNIGLITCLFDSLNFLLSEADLARALQQFSDALTPDGLLYFDVVTERMVTEHFEDQRWTERNGGFTTTWQGHYDHDSGIADTRVQVNSGQATIIRERMYSQGAIEGMIAAAGLQVLGVVDANTWRAPSRRSTRLDFVVTTTSSFLLRRKFRLLSRQVQELLA